MDAATLKTIAQIAIFVGAFLVASGTLVNYFAGNRVDVAKDRDARKRHRELQEQMTEKNAELSRAIASKSDELAKKSDEIANLNRGLAKKSEEIARISTDIAGAVTGGESYAYLEPKRRRGDVTYFVRQAGKYPTLRSMSS